MRGRDESGGGLFSYVDVEARVPSDHPLRGVWKGYREFHIEPDWLLIYRVKGDELHLVRTGSHADLFNE